MEDRFSRFYELFGGGDLPEVSDDVLDLVEDFLLCAMVQNYSPTPGISTPEVLVRFFTSNLTYYLTGKTTLAVWEIGYQRRLLRGLRFFRSDALTPELTNELEQIGFRYVSESTGVLQQLAFVFLLDHFQTMPATTVLNKWDGLLKWIMGFLNNTAQFPENLNEEMLMTVVYSTRSLVEMEQTPLTGIHVDMTVRILQICSQLLELARTNVSVFEKYEFIIAKCLRLASRLMSRFGVTNEAVIQEFERIPMVNDVKYSRIFQNYLTASCAIVKSGARFQNPEQNKAIVKQITTIMDVLILPPYLTSKRTGIYIRTLQRWCHGQPHTASLKGFIMKMWPFIGNFQTQAETMSAAYDILERALSDRSKENKNFHIEILEELVSVLELMRIDLDTTDLSGQKPFDARNWLRANMRTMKLFLVIQPTQQESAQSTSEDPLLVRLSPLCRLFRYMAYLLDLAKTTPPTGESEPTIVSVIVRQMQVKQFRMDVREIFIIFIQLLSGLPAPLLSYLLSKCLVDLLPSLDNFMMQDMIKGLMMQCDVFYVAFFQTIANNFEKLFLPIPPAPLLEMTRVVFQLAFTTEDPQRAGERRVGDYQKSIYENLSNNLYLFVISALTSKSSVLMELLLVMSHMMLNSSKNQKLKHFKERLERLEFSMHTVLKAISEEPGMDIVVSRLALFLYPHCHHPKSTEAWVMLFLPALESEVHMTTAIPALYAHTSSGFPTWTAELKEPVRSRFVTALTAPLTKITPKELINSPRSLLSKIPDIASKLAISSCDQKKKTQTAMIDGIDICVDHLFDVIKKQTNVEESDLENLNFCMCQLIEQHNFMTATSNQLICQIAEFISQNAPGLFHDSLAVMKTDHSKCALLFLQQKYQHNAIESLSQLATSTNVIANVATLCYFKNTVVTALEIISELIDSISNREELVRVVSALLHAAQFEPKIAGGIMQEHIYTRRFEGENRIILTDICSCLDSFALLSNDRIRKLALKSLKYFIVHKGVTTKMDDNRAVVLPKISERLKSNSSLFAFTKLEFLFLKPFTDVSDPLDLIENLLRFLNNCLSQTNSPNGISPEVQRLFKVLDCQDQMLMPHVIAKFAVKFIAKLFIVCQPTPRTQEVWDKTLVLFIRDNKFRSHIKYFLKRLRKEITTNQGYRGFVVLSHNIFGACKEVYSASNIMILRFICEYSSVRDAYHSGFVDYLIDALRSNLDIVAGKLQSRRQDEEAFKQIFKFTKLLKDQNSKVPLISFANTVMDMMMYMHRSMPCFETSVHYFANAYPDVLCECIIMRMQEWSLDFFVVVCEMLTKLRILRLLVFEKLCANFFLVKKYITDHKKDMRFDLELMVSTVMRMMATVWELDESESDVSILLSINKELFDFLYQSIGAPYMPSAFGSALHVFLPVKHAHVFNENDRLFDTFMRDFATVFIRYPSTTERVGNSNAFLNPIFNRRFIAFMSQLDGAKQSELFQQIRTVECQGRSKILQNTLIADIYNTFFQDTHTVTVGFSDYPSVPIHESMLLHYTGAQIGAAKNMKIADLSSCAITNMNAFVHSLCLRDGIMNAQSLKSFTRLLKVVSQLTPSEDGDEVSMIVCELMDKIPDFLDVTSYMLEAPRMFFKYSGQQNTLVDHATPSHIQFVLGFSARMLAKGGDNFDQWAMHMPYVFRNMYHEETKYMIGPKIFDILLSTVVSILTQNGKGTVTTRMIPQIIELWHTAAEPDLVNLDLVAELKQKLMEPPAIKSPISAVAMMKFLFHLVPVIADILFKDNTERFFPKCLMPGGFFSYQSDVLTTYEKALRACFVAGGIRVGNIIIQEMYSALKRAVSDVSEPLPVPFATVAQWIKEVSKEKNIINNLKVLLDVFCPQTNMHMYKELMALKQPLHPTVAAFLDRVITNDFPGMVRLCYDNPCTKLMFIPQSRDLVQDCWRMNWLGLAEESHIVAFAQMVFPKPVSKIVWHFTEHQMKHAIIKALNCITIPYEFDKFAHWYVEQFPRSILSECIATTPIFASSPPFPELPLFVNMSFLDQCYLCEDSLGLLKDTHPSMTEAASFHQISDYRAAKFYYMQEMYDKQDLYFHGLIRLRTISTNLTLPTTGNLSDKMLTVTHESSVPSIILPFFQDSSSHEFKSVLSSSSQTGTFTSFLSHSYIPFFLRSALVDEVYLCLKIMQQRTKLEHSDTTKDLLKLSKVIWIKALDKEMIMASNLAWRLTVLKDFMNQSNSEELHKEINESITANRMALIRLLADSGDVRGALKLLKTTWNTTTAKPFRVTDLNLPLIEKFMNGNHMFYPRMKFDVLVLLHKFQEAYDVMNSMPERNELWTKFLVQVINGTGVTMCNNMPERIIEQLVMSHIPNVKPSKLDFYIALVMSLIRYNTELVPVFWRSLDLRPASLSEEVKSAWMRWMPVMFQVSHIIPEQAVLALIRTHPIKFILMYNQIVYTRSYHPDLPIQNISALVSREERLFIEFNNAFKWLSMCRDDLAALTLTVNAHMTLYKSLAINKAPVIPDDLKAAIGGDTFELLERFCEEHPPYFKTNIAIPSMKSVTGLRLPLSPYHMVAMNMFLEAQGNSEASLVVTGMKGETRTFSLVSPVIYRLNMKEQLLMHCLSSVIEHEQSSRTRTIFMHYPDFYTIDKHLTMVLTNSPVSGMHELVRPLSMAHLLSYAKMQVEDDDTSPGALAAKRTRELPNDCLYRWVIQGTESGQIDFLFMRQSLASHFACYSYLRFAFQSQFLVLPSIMLFDDRQRMCIPGFIDESQDGIVAHLPLTDQIKTLLPPFVLRGSCATTWHTMANAITKKKDVVRIYLTAVLPFDKDQRAAARVIRRSKMAATNMNSTTENYDDCFAFRLFEHLIETSNNAMHCQPRVLAWI